MNKKKPLVSVVVPTKNRYFYLKKLIKLVDGFGFSEELELVIQDNTEDNSEILEFLNDNEFSNLQYYHIREPLTVGENFDLGIRNSTGEYVSCIGDDDAVTRYLVDCVKWMKENKLEGVFPERITFFWPEAYPGCKGDLHYKSFTGEVRLVNTNEVLKDIFDKGCINTGNLPLLYRGVVSRECLDKIWAKCGTYFPGASPDIANAVSICLVIEKFVVISAPIVIGGNSKTGGGGVNFLKYHAQTDFTKLPHLPKNIKEIWCKKIPLIWSNPTIWCESVVEALNAWGRSDLIEEINFEKLYEYFVLYYFHYRKMAFELSNNKMRLLMQSCFNYSSRCFNGIIYRIKTKLGRKKYSNGRLVVSGFDDFNEVLEHLNINDYNFMGIDHVRIKI